MLIDYHPIATRYRQRLSSAAPLEQHVPAFSYEKATEQGKALHDTFFDLLIVLGYAYAPEENHNSEKGPLTSPHALPFDALDDKIQVLWEVQTDIARTTYCDIHPTTLNSIRTLLYDVAQDIHDAFCKTLVDCGYTYGVEDNEEKKVTASLLPFGVLFNAPEQKWRCDYAIKLARLLTVQMVLNAEPAHATELRGKSKTPK